MAKKKTKSPYSSIPVSHKLKARLDRLKARRVNRKKVYKSLGALVEAMADAHEAALKNTNKARR